MSEFNSRVRRTVLNMNSEFFFLMTVNKAVIKEALRKTHKIESETPYTSNTISETPYKSNTFPPFLDAMFYFLDANERLCGNALFLTLTLYDCSRIASTERVSLSPTSASLPKFM